MLLVWATCWTLAQGLVAPLDAWSATGTGTTGAATNPARGSAEPTPSVAPVPAWVEAVAVPSADGLARSPVQLLLADRQTRLEKAGALRYQHIVRQINEVSGLEKASQIEVDFDPGYERLTFHKVEVWRGNQRLNRLDRKAIKVLHRETQLDRQMVDGRLTALLVLEDLRVGDRVEWSLTVSGDNPVFEGRFVSTEWTRSAIGPAGLMRYRLQAPVQRDIRFKVPEGLVEVRSQDAAGWRTTVFSRSQVPAFQWDDAVPAATYLADQIELSEFKDWREVAEWAQRLFARAMQTTPELDARVAALQVAGSTPEQQLKAALDFVQQEVRYFGTEMGASSHQPAPADQVLRQRFGDCKDKAALLSVLLRRLGFDATPVLVSSGYREAVNQRLPSPLAFDHAIAQVRRPGAEPELLWLDATRSQQTGAVTTRQSLGMGAGLLAAADQTALTPMPRSQDQLRVETVDTFRFARLAEEGQLESVTTLHGEQAEWLREARARMTQDEFDRLASGEILRHYNRLVQTGPALLEEVPDRNAVRLTVRFRTGEFWRFQDQRVLQGDFVLVNLISAVRLPDQAPRTQALRLTTPGLYRQTLRYEFGEDTFATPSTNRFDDTSGPHYALHLRYEVQTRSQTVEAELQQTADQLAAADWTRYRDRLMKLSGRLSGVFTISPLTSAQAEALRGRLTALVEVMRQGKAGVSTRNQADARTKLMLMEAYLSANRLPPKARAQAELAAGIQLDHLGRVAEAQPALERALALDPDNAEVRDALATNAFMRGQDQEAVQRASQALEAAPGSLSSRYARGWAHYFAGNFGAAREDWQAILADSAEQQHSYGAIWLYFTSRRLGEDPQVALTGRLPTESKPAWPYAALQWMLGRTSFDEAMAATRDGSEPNRGRECELLFFAGEKAWLDGDAERARKLWSRAVDTGVVEFTEYTMAQRRLQRPPQR